MAELPTVGGDEGVWGTKYNTYHRVGHAADGTHDQAGLSLQTVNVQSGAVNTGNTLMPFDDTIPQKTEGDQYMTLAITPKSATNKLKIDVVFFFAVAAVKDVAVALFQDTTTNALAAGSFRPEHPNIMREISFTHYMTTGTTSETTFKVRAGTAPATATTITFNGASTSRKLGGVMASSITITEIAV